MWSPDIDIALGGLGVGFALMSIARRRQGKPLHPDAAKADVGLLIFGLLLAAMGGIRLLVG